METVLTESPREAAAHLRAGELVAFPTETVYGLGADALDPEAVAKIFRAKGRPTDNPLIVHVPDRQEVERVARELPPVAGQLLEAFSPGPLTLVLPRHPQLPAAVSAGLDTVAVRIPSHETALSFLRHAGTPVAAPSANRSGRPSPTYWEAVQSDLGGTIACILKGDRSEVGLESTVVDCTDEVPVILRAGSITLDDIRRIAPGAVHAAGGSELAARSPGTRHRHYAPEARVVVVSDPRGAVANAASAYIGLQAHPDAGDFARYCHPADVAAYAHELFAFFRRCDAAGVEVIYALAVPPEGLGLALMDRIARAARR